MAGRTIEKEIHEDLTHSEIYNNIDNKCFTRYLRKSISDHDTMAKEERKENFYQAVMMEILVLNEG